MSAVCDPAQGCVYTALKCKAPGQCIEWYCDNTTQVCASRAPTPLPAACNTTTVPQCIDSSDCNDRTNCTTDACVAGKCVFTPITCPASTKCSFTTCKPSIGCYTQNLTCTGQTACNVVSCDPSIGCVTKNITCPPSTDPCFTTICDDKKGCDKSPKICNITAVNCTTPVCNQTCYLKNICVPQINTGEENAPPTTIILAATISTAAIAGIAVGAIVVVGAIGGGAVVAAAGGAGAGGVTAVFSNPVYAGTAMSGTNPINQQG